MKPLFFLLAKRIYSFSSILKTSALGVLLLFTSHVNANITPSQEEEIQTLKDQLEAATNQYQKAGIISELISIYSGHDTSIAVQYISTIQQFEPEVSNAFYPFVKGLYLNKLSKYQSAKPYFISAISAFQQNKDHAQVAECLEQLSYCYSFTGLLDSALITLEQSKHLLEKEKLTKDEQHLYAMLHGTIGTIYRKMAQYDSAMWYMDKAISLKESSDDPSWAIDVSNKGNIYLIQGDLVKGAEHYLKAVHQFEKINDLKNANTTYLNLSIIHLNLEQYDEEKKYIEKSIGISKRTNDNFHLAYGLLMLSANNTHYEKHEKAKELNLKALTLSHELKNDVLISRSLYQTGESYSILGIADSAFYYLSECRSFCEQSNAIQVALFYAMAAKGLGSYYLNTNQYQSAIPFLNEYLNWEASNRGNLSLQGEVSEKLARAYAGIGDYQQAYQYHQQYKILNDSILNQENIAAITEAETEARYVAEQEKQALALEAERKEQRFIQYSLLGGIATLLLLSALIYRNYRIKNKANQTIEKQKEQLEYLNQTKDRIFAIIGHDMRKPVLSFRGIAKKVNYLLQKQDFETLNAIGGQIEQNALALNELTDNLLNWALLQKEALTLNPASIPLAEVIEEIIELFKGAADNKNIHIQTDIPDNLEVLTDLHAFRTIIRNLIDNAIKYTPENGQVSIRASKIPTGVEIEVSDTGVGIAEDKLQNIFLLQNDKSTRGTAGEKGTGLGMHLVKELTKINKGAIDVKSQVGKGTLFVLTFPS